MRAWQETQMLRNGGHPGFVTFWEQVRGREDEIPAPTELVIKDNEKIGWSFTVTWSWWEKMDVVPFDYEYAESWTCFIQCDVTPTATTWTSRLRFFKDAITLDQAIELLKKLHVITSVPWRDSSKPVSANAMASVRR
jgi:hypothetical protein